MCTCLPLGVESDCVFLVHACLPAWLSGWLQNFPVDLQGRSKDIKKSCWLNMAQVAIKEGRWDDVRKSADKVLELDAANVKALYRRAMALMKSQDYFEAELDLKKALDAEPNNADVKALEKQLKVGRCGYDPSGLGGAERGVRGQRVTMMINC